MNTLNPNRELLKMQRFHLWILLLAPAMLLIPFHGQSKDIIGYYQSWKWQNNREQLNPQVVPYDKLTILAYAFFYPQENGKIVGIDPVADRYLLEGKIDYPAESTQPGNSIIKLAHDNGTKVVLSIGGWDHSDNFPQVAADPQKRANFAHWCINHINHYGFDGIDIDWEFPGYINHNGTPQDRQNFTLLLQAARDSLTALTESTGKNYLLSAALPAAAGHLPDIEVQEISRILDYMSIMTYDLFGPWGAISNHNSALYGPQQGDSARCLDGAFKLYHRTHQIPEEKLNLGVAFYGHSYANCVEIYAEHQGADATLFQEEGGIDYSDIAKYAKRFDRRWDQKAQVPYLVSEQRKIVVSFDDEESIGLKADYVLQHNARGLIIWPLMGDYMKDGSTPLLDAVYNKFTTK